MPAAATYPQRLYLCYGRDEHAEDAVRLAEALKQRGHMVWFDQTKLRDGVSWEQAIEQGIASCDWFILLMTPHSVRRPDGFCLNELTKAAELGKRIVPILLEDVPRGAPLLICNIQYLDWRDTVPFSAFPERLEQKVSQLCAAIEGAQPAQDIGENNS